MDLISMRDLTMNIKLQLIWIVHHLYRSSVCIVIILFFLLTPNQNSSFVLNRTLDALAQNSLDSTSEGDRSFHTGIKQFRQNQFQAALESYQQALQLYRNENNIIRQSVVLYHIGITNRYLGVYPASRDALEAALNLNLAQNFDRSLLIGQISSELGIAYYNLGDYEKAVESCERAREINKQVNDSTLEAKTLAYLGLINFTQGDYDRALELHQTALEFAEETSDRALQGEILNGIALVYNNRSQHQQALELNQQALALSQEANNRFIEARIISSLGVTHIGLSQYDRALEYYQQALKIRQEIGDRAGTARSFNFLGSYYHSQGQYEKALELYERSLRIRQEIEDRLGEGNSLISIGSLQFGRGQYDRSLEFYQQALNIYQSLGGIVGLSSALANIGSVYSVQGEYAKALEYYQQALAIRQELGNEAGIAEILNEMGGSYYVLGDRDRALEYYQQAATIQEKIGDRASLARTINNIGLIYDLNGNYQTALEFYQRSLAIREDIGNKAGQSKTLNNIGAIYTELEQYDRAISIYERALNIQQDIGDRAGEANTLGNLGLISEYTEKLSQALQYYQRALNIFQEIGDRRGEQTAFNNIGSVLEQQSQIDLAILFYKQSINTTEAIRKNIRELPITLQESYTETVSERYRHLADLLLQQDRILEAQRILDLLKVQELQEYLQNVRGNEQTEIGIEYLPTEQAILDEYKKLQNRAIALGNELEQLRQIPEDRLTQEQEQNIIELITQQQQLTQNFVEFSRSPDVREQVQQRSQTEIEQSLNLSSIRSISDDLKQQNAVLLYPLILDDRLELILATPGSPPIRRTVYIKREELNRTIVEFRQGLTNVQRPASSVVIPLGIKLYDWLIAPFESELRQLNAETIIYAPDGQLRYIPLAALHDRNGWLIERFRINNITAQSLTNLNTPPQEELRILAGAFSEGNYEFPIGDRIIKFSGLPFAEKEVENLANLISNTNVLMNDRFNKTAILRLMDGYPIVHFATHATLVNGIPEESFIVLGDGDRISLGEVRDTWRLTNVDLMVLSACQTGLGAQLGNGEEILGFGYLMQTAGARATMASLWIVSDGGTQVLMNAFYESLKQDNITKAEALRQAQIALINNESTSTFSNLQHPYYWASFLLIGNGL